MRPGLTLIELLVSIVVLITVLTAVLPAISPDNNARRIREASRQLNSLFAQAQAQAARDGRPVGVGFVDRWNDADNDGVIDAGETTGMAFEAFIVAEPPPFTGFSESSSVRISQVPNAPPTNPNQLPPLMVTFGHGVGGEGIVDGDPSDVIPPNMFRPGDLIEIGQEVFRFTNDDEDDESESTPFIDESTGYFTSQKKLTVRWQNWNIFKQLPRGGRAYRIRRQPATGLQPSRSSAGAIQFPRGVGIDFDPTEGNLSLTVMFSPNGTMESYYRDGDKEDPDSLFILIGLAENANPRTSQSSGPPDIDYTRYDFSSVSTDDAGDELLAQRREQVNLLNADSRWVVVAPSGRCVTSENVIFDPRHPDILGDPPRSASDQRDEQREAAQDLADDFQSEGGR